jgi:two-component system sensor histidine kinase BaeS
MAADLADAEARRRELVSNIAHELRTPLTSLTGYVQGMADGVFPADPGTLHPMLDEPREACQLVDDMTLLSRAESADMPLRLQRLPVGALVDAAMTVARPLAAERDVTLESAVAPSLPDLLVDPDWSRAVLVNLLSNAITHGRAGGHVNITAAEGASGVTVVVSDDGPGIDQGDLPHVFERFYRADRSRARRGGSGIGLAVVKQVVTRHGGEVSVGRSTAGGAAVAVTLPRWQGLRTTNEAAAPTDEMTVRSSTSHAGSPRGAATRSQRPSLTVPGDRHLKFYETRDNLTATAEAPPKVT